MERPAERRALRARPWRRGARRGAAVHRRTGTRRDELGKMGASGPPPHSASHDPSATATSRRSGVQRVLRPLPEHRTCAPAPRSTSRRRRERSSALRRPVSVATSSKTPSRLPIHVVPIGRGDERHGLLLAEEIDRSALVSLRGNRKDALALQRARRLDIRDETEERAQSSEADVSRLRGVGPVLLKVVEEVPDQCDVDLFDAQADRRSAQALRREGEQQPERVAVGNDGVWTRAELRPKPLGEEALEKRRESRRGHRTPPSTARSRRSVARRSSSGTAWMYQ